MSCQEWDLIIKGFGVLGAFVGGFIGLWRYFDTSEKQFRKPYWERQLALYFEATEAASSLATGDVEQQLEEAKKKFWILYWGPLALVEDREVEASMVQFAETLAKYENGTDCREELKNRSLALAHTCRESIGKSWKMELGKLQSRSV